jgi:hypothetical protein
LLLVIFDTVYFCEGIPVEWYFALYSGEVEIKRKKQDNILIQEIIDAFVSFTDIYSCRFNCVAYFEGFTRKAKSSLSIFTVLNYLAGTPVSIFMDQSDLKLFLNNCEGVTGILQRFIDPLGFVFFLLY